MSGNKILLLKYKLNYLLSRFGGKKDFDAQIYAQKNGAKNIQNLINRKTQNLAEEICSNC